MGVDLTKGQFVYDSFSKLGSNISCGLYLIIYVFLQTTVLLPLVKTKVSAKTDWMVTCVNAVHHILGITVR